jgi:formylglycine-generating enzyme required for sulfatase activity
MFYNNQTWNIANLVKFICSRCGGRSSILGFRLVLQFKASKVNILPKGEGGTTEAKRQNELSSGKGVSFNPNSPIEMVFVNGGTFVMGNTDEENFPNEYPVHAVMLDDFYIGKYLITQAQWKSLMGGNPSKFKGDNLPVEMVSWDDVQTFIGLLNMRTDSRYRLPTEAEWEYAARGGAYTKGSKYSGSDNLDAVVWFDEDVEGTRPVGKKQANELGIYDMSGNVEEWCSDWYDNYDSISQVNPEGPETGFIRVARGGCWDCDTVGCRVADRSFSTPDYHSRLCGFRLACSSKIEQKSIYNQ